MRACVIGLGQVGLPTAAYIKQQGVDVVGYDVDRSKVVAATRTGLNAADRWEDVVGCDTYVVCVGTGWARGQPDLTALADVTERLRGRLQPEDLVAIESTAMPGTCRRIFGGLASKGGRLVHVPHRYWAGDPAAHGVNQLRVLGAIDARSLEAGRRFYFEALDIPLHILPSLEAAEMCKVAENAYRFVQIAYAEELRMVCEQAGVDFEQVRAACNTKWNIEIPEARDGIRGHCLPKDARTLAHLSHEMNGILAATIATDERYKKWIAARREASCKA